ncbi:hypothetical protein [Clavibacter michiganensis]|uniref:hypothetical protein n=1 Tax=Clavibacter michiganensis TaxID=28447 RepID=UPI00345BBB89
MTDHQIDVTPAQRDALAALVQRHQDAFETPTGRAGSWNTLDHDLAALIRSSGSPLVVSDADVEYLRYACEREEWTGRDRPWNSAPADLRPVVSVIENLAGEIKASLRPRREFSIAVTDDQHDSLIAAVERYANSGDVLGYEEAYLAVSDTARHVRAPGPVVVLTSGDLSIIADVIRVEGWAQKPGMESLVDRVTFAMQELRFRDTSQPLSPADELGVIRATDVERAALAPYVERYIAYLEDMQAPESILTEARQTLLQVAAPDTEIRVSPTDRKVLADLVQVEEWDREWAAVAEIPAELSGLVERIIANIDRARWFERATQSVETPSFPTPQEVATAVSRAEQGIRVDDPRLTRYVELVETVDRNLSVALDSPTLIGHIEDQIRQAKGGLEGLVRPGTEEDRVDAIGFAKLMHGSLQMSGGEARTIARPTWWDYEAVAAARHMDWSPLAESPAEGLLVGIHGTTPEADTLRKARSAALVEIRFDQDQKLVAAPDYPQPVPDVFALGAYTWQISTPAEMFTTEGYPWVGLLARELALTPVPDAIGFGRDFTPAEQAQAKVFIAALSEELAARGYPVDAAKLDLGRVDSELEVAAHARDLGGSVEAMWEAGYASRLESGHAWATAEPAAQDDIARQVLTEKVATYAEVQQLTAAVRAAKPTDERLFSDFDTVSAEPLARQGERAMERLAWIAGRWDGLDPVIQDGIDRVGAMTAELSAVPTLQRRSTSDVRETRSLDWSRTADAGVIGLERAQTEQGLAALQRPEQTRGAPTRAPQAPAPAADADEGLSGPPRPRGLSARIEAEVARRTPSTSDRLTETDKTRSR